MLLLKIKKYIEHNIIKIIALGRSAGLLKIIIYD